MKQRVLLIMLMFPAFSAPQAQMTEDDLLDVLRQAERAIQNFRFSFESKRFTISQDGKEQKTKEVVQSRGVIATGNQPFFNIHTQSKLRGFEDGRLVDGGIPSQYQGSYDGKQGKELHYGGPSQQTPENGVIKREPNTGGIILFTCGLDLMLPFYVPMGDGAPTGGGPMGLVHRLENHPSEQGEWRIEPTDSPDVVRIIIPRKEPLLSEVIDVDLSKGGNIVRCGLWKEYGTPGARALIRGDDIVLEKQDSLWLPVSLAKYYGGNAPFVYRATIRYEAVNEPLTESDFDLEFPEGITVVNTIAGVHFTVGLTEELRENILSKSLDDLAHLRESPDAEPSSSKSPAGGYVAVAPPDQSGRAKTLRIVALTACAAACLAGAGIAVKVHRRRRPSE